MIDCKITENYLREKRRMIVDYEKDCGKPLLSFENGFEMNFPRLAIKIVQKWSNKHPRKTILDDLKEKYPNYQKSFKDGTPSICPYKLGYKDSGNCPADTCTECWNRPLDEVIK